ncbi:MAG: hypothetical protein ABF651_08935, partial [Sporolactobacillus sp.]
YGKMPSAVSPASTGKAPSAPPTATSPASQGPSWGKMPYGKMPSAVSPASTGKAPSTPPTATSPASQGPGNTQNLSEIPFSSNGSVSPDQSFVSGSSASPWMMPNGGNSSGMTTQNMNGQRLPDNYKGTIDGYPYPYMPAAQRPCNGCGSSPQPFSPFYRTPSVGYYAGNQPPAPYPGFSGAQLPLDDTEKKEK